MVDSRAISELPDKQRRQFWADVNQMLADELAHRRRTAEMMARQRIEHDDTYIEGEEE